MPIEAHRPVEAINHTAHEKSIRSSCVCKSNRTANKEPNLGATGVDSDLLELRTLAEQPR